MKIILISCGLFFLGWISAFIYCFMKYTQEDPNHSTGFFLANAMNDSLPTIFEIFGTLAIILFGYKLYLFLSSDNKRKISAAHLYSEKLKEEASKEADKIVLTAQYQAMEIECQIIVDKGQILRERQFVKEELVRIQQKLESDFKRKRQSYLDEISGLKSKLVQIEILTEIVYWYGQGKLGAVDRLKKKLKNLNKSTSEITGDNSKRESKEYEHEHGVDGEIGQ